MDTGYIKLFRKMTEWEWYDDLPTFKLFIHLLLKVNYKNSEWQGITIERGCCVTSIPKLAIETGLTAKQIRRAVDVLIRAGNVAKSSTSKYTIIKVLNYDLYQANDIVEGRQKADKGQTKGTQEGRQRATSKEEKEIKKNKNIKKENIKRKKDVDYQQIVEMYNNTCVSFPHLQKLSDSRKKTIKARLNTYSIEDIQRAFELAEESNFLKGQNNRNWSATFDWMMKDTNLAKILEGNYTNKTLSNHNASNGTKEINRWYEDQDKIQRDDEVHVDDEELQRLMNSLGGDTSEL